jgi:hypothetical protein
MNSSGKRLLSTILIGACWISTACTGEPPATVEQESAPVLKSADYGQAAAETDLLATDGLGEIRIAMEASEITDLLGEATKGAPEMSQADGLYYATWQYPDQGITLGMVSDSAEGGRTVASIRALPTCELKTRRGIGIGASYDAVAEAYADVHDRESSNPKTDFVAGSLYGGVMFTFEQDKVSQILIGAAGE